MTIDEFKKLHPEATISYFTNNVLRIHITLEGIFKWWEGADLNLDDISLEITTKKDKRCQLPS